MWACPAQMRPVACSALAGLVRASTHGAAGSSFVGLLAARGCKALPAPGCRCARSREMLHHTQTGGAHTHLSCYFKTLDITCSGSYHSATEYCLVDGIR